MYAVLLHDIWTLVPGGPGAGDYSFQMKSGITISKYNTEFNSWEDIVSTEFLVDRKHYCIVTHDNFIYFIGGTEWCTFTSQVTPQGSSISKDELRTLSDVDRYDLRRKQWDKLADIQVAREGTGHGAAANGKIFIAGMVHKRMKPDDHLCEMYNETTNEWQFIKCFSIEPTNFQGVFVVDEKLYALGEHRTSEIRATKVECYNADRDAWTLNTKVPAVCLTRSKLLPTILGTLKLFKGISLSPCRLTWPWYRWQRS